MKMVLHLSLFLLSLHANAESKPILQKIADLEATTQGHLGVYALNTANQETIAYRFNERFPTGCTSKVMGVAALLEKASHDASLLKQRVMFSKKDSTNWMPVTKKHFQEGMTLQELASAAISQSDNTAMNLILKSIGGIEGMNTFARSIGDTVFRQDHGWPGEAHSGGRGNIHDSSTPSAMVKSLQAIAFGNILPPHERELLLTWMKATTSGDKRIRAGVPRGWIVGNKTGTGFAYGTTNDLAIIWPPKGNPILLGVFYTSDDKDAGKREDVLAEVTRLVLETFLERKQT